MIGLRPARSAHRPLAGWPGPGCCNSVTGSQRPDVDTGAVPCPDGLPGRRHAPASRAPGGVKTNVGNAAQSLAREWSQAGSDADGTAAILPATGSPPPVRGWENPAPDADTAPWLCPGLAALLAGVPAPRGFWRSRARSGAGLVRSHTLAGY